MNAPQAARLPGGRLHLQHGPIDLVIGADGARTRAFEAAMERFATILDELVEELPALRRPLDGRGFNGQTARRMAAAVSAYDNVFITPMAAVAGAVAEEVLAAMVAAASPLGRAWVNNGGDIALHLNDSARIAQPPPAQADAGLTFRPNLTIAIAAPDAVPLGTIRITAASPIRGIATSGRKGRSLSLGIADSVTVLAHTAAAADTAATLIANAVDLPGHAAITRTPAHDLAPDSDLGARLVVTDVGALAPAEINAALDRGARLAQQMCNRGLIHSAALFLRAQYRLIGALPLARHPERKAEHA